MQHPVAGAMFPPKALPPEPHLPFYSPLYPPFALGNPLVYAKPMITGSRKREWTGPETDRKEYRDTEFETRDRNESWLKRGDDRDEKRLRYNEELMNPRILFHIEPSYPVSPSRGREESETGRVSKIVDPKRMEVAPCDMSREQRALSRGHQSCEYQESRGQQLCELESREREQRLRNQSSEKVDVKFEERERRRYEAAVNEHLRAGRHFDSRLIINSGLVDDRRIEARLYAANGNLRGIEPRKYDPRIRESVDVKSKRNLDEQSDENHRSKEHVPHWNERSNDRTLPEHLRVFYNDDGRPRSAHQCSTRSVSPQVNGADGKQNRSEIKFRGLDTASHPETTEAKRNESGNTIGQSMPSKTPSPLNTDDVVVSKRNRSNESSLSPSVSRLGTESSVGNAMRTGFGNLVMTPSGAGYPNLQMLNSDQQLILTEYEGRFPMLFPMPNGMFSHPGLDPSHGLNEYMLKPWREMSQGIDILL
ncbi:Hypothetical predicted protein [Paramuricea clavata]|uniref:Uncharacterized protein n=1 Tax=Paramuricea clavata TaxID=317549 RepID=A0A6S7HBE2_PARCT|nr:Hypothetical predicted protein [Paramuricea clavata]